MSVKHTNKWLFSVFVCLFVYLFVEATGQIRHEGLPLFVVFPSGKSSVLGVAQYVQYVVTQPKPRRNNLCVIRSVASVFFLVSICCDTAQAKAQ